MTLLNISTPRVFPLPEPTLQAIAASRLISSLLPASGGLTVCGPQPRLSHRIHKGFAAFLLHLPSFCMKQLAAVFDDVLTVDAVKLVCSAMLKSITTVKTWLAEHPVPVVYSIR